MWLIYSVVALAEEMVIGELCWEVAAHYMCGCLRGRPAQEATQRV